MTTAEPQWCRTALLAISILINIMFLVGREAGSVPASVVDRHDGPSHQLSSSSIDATVTLAPVGDAVVVPFSSPSAPSLAPAVETTSFVDESERSTGNATHADDGDVIRVKHRKPFKIGNKDAVFECMQSANMTRWFFTGTSHTRNIFEMFSALLSNYGFVSMKDKGGFIIPPPLHFNTVKFLFARNNMLQTDIRRLVYSPPKLEPFQVAMISRFMWDMDVNNTWPHDFYHDTIGVLAGLRKTHQGLVKKSPSSAPLLRRVFLHMPHDVKAIDPTGPDGFLTQKLQCRIPARIKMYRRLSRCAAHFVNTRLNTSSAANVTTAHAFPKVELFDVFEYSKTLPDDMVWGGGHHYEPPALQAMLGQFLDRHVCPGRNIAGASGVNNADALPFDKDPWANVEEDCREIFEAAEQNASKLHYGPIGAGVYEGQRFPSPTIATLDNMHLYRNFTPVNKATGEFLLNGFRIRPRGMRPIDKVFQNVFDRRAQSCACMRSHRNDGCQLDHRPQSSKQSVAHYCESKKSWDEGNAVEALPTYMNFTAMNRGHWEELLTLLSVNRTRGSKSKARVQAKKRRDTNIQTCLFNLGARSEDVLDSEYLSRLRFKVPADSRFMCQCSGVFAPHLVALKNKMGSSAFKAQWETFCHKVWAPQHVSDDRIHMGVEACGDVFTGLDKG